MLYSSGFCKEGEQDVVWAGESIHKERSAEEDEGEERLKLERQERDEWRNLSAPLSGVRRIASTRAAEAGQTVRCWDERIEIGGLQNVGDAATAIAIHAKFYAVGTQRGRVLVTDFRGNHLHAFDKVHSAAVTDVAVSSEGDPIATCSRDGTVAVLSIYMKNARRVHTFPHPLRTITLCPRSGVQAEKGVLDYRFATGGKSGSLHLVTPLRGLSRLLKTTEKSFKQTSILVKSGAVHAVKWRADLIAYCADDGLYVYDHSAKCQVPVPDLGLAKRAESEWRCSVSWETHEVLLVSWGSEVLCLCVMPCPTGEMKGKETRYEVAMLSRYSVADNAIICGVAPFGAKLVILTIGSPAQQRDTATSADSSDTPSPSAARSRPQPELRVMDRDSHGKMMQEQVYALKMAGVENLYAMHYHLAHEDSWAQESARDSAFIVLTPVEVMSVQPRDTDAQMALLAVTGRLPEAVFCLSMQEYTARSAIEQADKDHRTAHETTFKHSELYHKIQRLEESFCADGRDGAARGEEEGAETEGENAVSQEGGSAGEGGSDVTPPQHPVEMEVEVVEGVDVQEAKGVGEVAHEDVEVAVEQEESLVQVEQGTAEPEAEAHIEAQVVPEIVEAASENAEVVEPEPEAEAEAQIEAPIESEFVGEPEAAAEVVPAPDVEAEPETTADVQD